MADALVALSLWTVDREIGGRSAQPTSVIPNSGMNDGGVSPHGEMNPRSVLRQNDKFYRPASSVLGQIAANESSSAENDHKDHNKRTERL
jgi:hypothetical protein